MNEKNIIKRLDPPQFLLLIFLTFIFIGTLLLKLPLATTDHITVLNAFFTATSAMTVTGLIVVDTGTAFTLFGQIIILLLIQLGGLGIMTFAVFIFLMAGRKIGFKEHVLITQSLNQNSIGGVIILAKKLLAFSLIVETIVFTLLSIRWVPILGWKGGLFASLFHSISAFNNAGFSTWSDSLSRFIGDPIINIIITFSFILGGIGFTVIFDIWKKKTFGKFSLHTKLMVIGTIIINIISIIFVLSLEFDNPKTIGNLSLGDKIQASYFQALTPRTAGFNTLEIASLNDPTLFFIILLMFIGAGSASTGGGIKLTTFLALMLSVSSFIKKESEISIFQRAITDSTVVRSLAITVIGVTFVFIGIFILDITEDASFIMIVFEAVSAFGTVGLSMGLTGDLTSVGKVIIITIMVIGKVGPLTLAFSIANHKKVNVRYAREEILTG
ncbi:trk system potassium uptake protein TrkH [Virgibacillus subterraneus]|uniref:Trk system potassium uptake protein TrkH n=1 Tax=Virgibacillus subterraneus TaxID=621109 RepID=A0A1H8Z914_9BACI|nr:TrkH family potassium uptake protein [Virgibacillus subterraneus]SEP60930.1 trk system potassium uptake protein TrkH [Virgibacillus subterraneus]